MHRRARPQALILALMMAATGSLFVVAPAIASEPDEPPPYHAREFDLVDLPFDRLPWTSDPPPVLPAIPPIDDKGIRMFRWNDGGLYYRPGSIAINGMKRIDAFRDTGDRAQLEQALVQAKHLRDMRIEADDAWWLPFWFDYSPEGLTAPWFNAMSQGLVLSFFVRLHRVTGDDLHLRAAEKVFKSYRRLGRKKAGPQRPWVAYVADGGYLWLEHYPNARPDHVLNAHMHALIGIYEYWQHTRSPEARQLLEGALTTMRDRAATYRREGRVSLYGLHSRTNHYKYHQVHIWQLRLLGRMTGDPFFSELASALAADRGPRRNVPGKPAESRAGPVLNRSPQVLRKSHYPVVRPASSRTA
ncbi:MAG: D-glucuronyl C5-epimerase family protein [Chloroflexota bacterium]|nr:D-glucuronyl C5-epimerase family protein [Chloroflexota bacterium]